MLSADHAQSHSSSSVGQPMISADMAGSQCTDTWMKDSCAMSNLQPSENLLTMTARRHASLADPKFSRTTYPTDRTLRLGTAVMIDKALEVSNNHNNPAQSPGENSPSSSSTLPITDQDFCSIFEGSTESLLLAKTRRRKESILPTSARGKDTIIDSTTAYHKVGTKGSKSKFQSSLYQELTSPGKSPGHRRASLSAFLRREQSRQSMGSLADSLRANFPSLGAEDEGQGEVGTSARSAPATNSNSYGYEDPDEFAARKSVKRMQRRSFQRRCSVTKFSLQTRSAIALAAIEHSSAEAATGNASVGARNESWHV